MNSLVKFSNIALVSTFIAGALLSGCSSSKDASSNPTSDSHPTPPDVSYWKAQVSKITTSVGNLIANGPTAPTPIAVPYSMYIKISKGADGADLYSGCLGGVKVTDLSLSSMYKLIAPDYTGIILRVITNLNSGEKIIEVSANLDKTQVVQTLHQGKESDFLTLFNANCIALDF